MVVLTSCAEQNISISSKLRDCKLTINTEDKWDYTYYPDEENIITISNDLSTLNLVIDNLDDKNIDVEKALTNEIDEATQEFKFCKIIEKKNIDISNHKAIFFKTEFAFEEEDYPHKNLAVVLVNNGKYMKFINTSTSEKDSIILMNFVKGITFDK